jgi:hypothetical protein
MASFSPSVLRCFGAGTRLASTICPAMGMHPFFRSCQSNAFITRFSVPVSVSLFRNSRMVFSSGVAPPRSKPRNRIQDSRSRIMNSIRASLRLCCACRISALNSEAPNATGSSERAEHGVERRPAALRSVAIAQPLDQPAPEALEIHRRLENLQRIPVLAQRLEMLRQAEEASLIHETVSRSSRRKTESQTPQDR